MLLDTYVCVSRAWRGVGWRTFVNVRVCVYIYLFYNPSRPQLLVLHSIIFRSGFREHPRWRSVHHVTVWGVPEPYNPKLTGRTIEEGNGGVDIWFPCPAGLARVAPPAAEDTKMPRRRQRPI